MCSGWPAAPGAQIVVTQIGRGGVQIQVVCPCPGSVLTVLRAWLGEARRDRPSIESILIHFTEQDTWTTACPATNQRGDV